MSKYFVTLLYNANETVKVEANSPLEASKLAEGRASLCHSCSNHLDLGDVFRYIVLYNEGNELYDSAEATP